MKGHWTSETYLPSLPPVPVGEGLQPPSRLFDWLRQPARRRLGTWAVPSAVIQVLGSVLVITAVAGGCGENGKGRPVDGVIGEHEVVAQDALYGVLESYAGHDLDCRAGHDAADGEILACDHPEMTSSPEWPCEPGRACSAANPCGNGCSCMLDEEGNYCTWDCVFPEDCPGGWDCIPIYLIHRARWQGFCIRPSQRQ